MFRHVLKLLICASTVEDKCGLQPQRALLESPSQSVIREVSTEFVSHCSRSHESYSLQTTTACLPAGPSCSIHGNRQTQLTPIPQHNLLPPARTHPRQLSATVRHPR
ncbi:hypothetical protein BDR06DRAFT_643062 [Suillus hirtellus]|nr:hypothetical protein BDR06DRAFT_643062 [Suillus hirtellus]